MFYRSVLLAIILSSSNLSAKTVKYDLDIAYKKVNITGVDVIAMVVGGKIPAPTIEATVGDILQVTFNNKLDAESSIHWHGILLPNAQDGVPYLTTQPIQANSSFTYRYKIKHAGTYWYHSHTGLQEQRGIYGSLVFHPKNGERIKSDKDHVVVLSDWTNENPKRVIANLKKDGDYYALKKHNVQSWDKVFTYGKQALKNRFQGAWSRMGPMDLSDVGYDAFLANGKQTSYLTADPGETVRLRLINAGASSYFNVEYADLAMTIVAADGVDVEPIKVKRLSIAIAETYDVLVTVPKKHSYELRATAADGTGYSSVFIGTGQPILAADIPRPNLLLINRSMHRMHNMPSMEYKFLRAIQDTSLPKNRPTREVELKLTGNMERYVWSFNNKTLLEENKIMIKKGDNVRFVLLNTTMMNHPIHLHGHFFRVLNGQGERSPLKHTVNVPPMARVVIEFAADEEKDWFFHCHNLYHMKSGMARVVAYENSSTVTKDIINNLAHDPWYFATDIATLSNMMLGKLRTSNTKNKLSAEFDYDYKKTYDIDLLYERSISRFFDIYTGANLAHHDNTGIFGIHYVLPMLIESDLRINSQGRTRIGLGTELELTARNKFAWEWNSDKEYKFILSYEVTKNILLTGIFDSDFKSGAGLRVKF